LCGAARWVIASKQHWGVASAALVGGALVAAVLAGRPRPLESVADAAALSAPPRRRRLLGSTLVALGLGAFGFAVYLLLVSWLLNFTVAAPLLIAGVAVWSAGLALWDGRRPRSAALAMPSWERWLFVAIVAFGFFLRFYRYDFFPPADGFCAVEEPQAGLVTHHIIHDGQRPWEFVLDRWLPVPAFLWWGETPIALRLPFTLVSALTLIPFYLLVRQLVSRPAALFSTALFAMSRWHLIYARLALNIFATTLIVVIILYLCIRAHQRGGLALYPWIGFLTAYTLYTYAGYRGTTLFVVLFLVVSVVGHLRTWRTAATPEKRRAAHRVVTVQLCGLAFAAVAYVSTVAPLVAQLRNEPAYFVEAAKRSLAHPEYYGGDFGTMLRQRVDRMRRTAEMFNHYGDEAAAFNLPTVPMLDPLTGVLFTVGLAYCVIWWRYRFQGFFAIMFIVLLLLGSTFVITLDIRRLQGIIPLIFVMIAFFVDRLAHAVQPRTRPVLIGLAVAAAAFAFRDNYTIYFRDMMTDPNVRSAFQNRHTVIVRYLHSLPRTAYVYAITDVPNVFIESDFTWWRGDTAPGKITSDLLPILTRQPGPWTGRDLHVIIQEPYERKDLVRLLRDAAPGARCAEVARADDPPPVRFTACDLPSSPAERPFAGGARARYFRGDSAVPLVERVEPAISWGLLPDECRMPYAREGSPPCRATWEGTWQVPLPDTYTVITESRQANAQVFVDGQPLTAPSALAAGPHQIRVEARFRSLEEAGVRLYWRNAATPTLQLMRFVATETGERS
jgi:hypothetical protein